MTIYANVGPDGVIVFEPHADRALARLPVARTDNPRKAKKFKEVISGLARHAYDGETLLVPGVPEAETQAAAMDALLRWRRIVVDALIRQGVNV
jgi:hypothetical protein